MQSKKILFYLQTGITWASANPVFVKRSLLRGFCSYLKLWLCCTTRHQRLINELFIRFSLKKCKEKKKETSTVISSLVNQCFPVNVNMPIYWLWLCTLAVSRFASLDTRSQRHRHVNQFPSFTYWKSSIAARSLAMHQAKFQNQSHSWERTTCQMYRSYVRFTAKKKTYLNQPTGYR
jgi:hypothetical protein